jgi:diguanylate cyclase (GGDEF)-like protein
MTNSPAPPPHPRSTSRDMLHAPIGDPLPHSRDTETYAVISSEPDAVSTFLGVAAQLRQYGDEPHATIFDALAAVASAPADTRDLAKVAFHEAVYNAIGLPAADEATVDAAVTAILGADEQTAPPRAPLDHMTHGAAARTALHPPTATIITRTPTSRNASLPGKDGTAAPNDDQVRKLALINDRDDTATDRPAKPTRRASTTSLLVGRSAAHLMALYDDWLGHKGRSAADDYRPYVVTGDAVDGGPRGACHDRILSLRSPWRLPTAWITGTRPGGWILTPLGADGRLVFALRVAEDLTERAAYLRGYQQCAEDQRPTIDALTELAFSDPLTGLPNRLAVDEHLAAAVQDGAPLVVGLIDVRGLKRVNDSAGHSTGDELLRMVGSTLRAAAVGSGAWLGHLSGDEFLWVTTGDREQPARTDVLIHTALTGCGIASPHFVQTEVSIGWATSYEVQADGVKDAAGIALAYAKRAHQRGGRSTVHSIVHSIRYRPDPSAIDAPGDVRIPKQVRRSAPGTVDRPTVGSSSHV